jgi:biopolymer transport protein ExbD
MGDVEEKVERLYEAVLRVMDELQRAQVKRVGLLVQPQGK